MTDDTDVKDVAKAAVMLLVIFLICVTLEGYFLSCVAH